MIGILMKKSPYASYVTFGGMSEFMMYEDENGDNPVYYYESTNPKRWYVKVLDFMLAKDKTGDTFE